MAFVCVATSRDPFELAPTVEMSRPFLYVLVEITSFWRASVRAAAREVGTTDKLFKEGCFGLLGVGKCDFGQGPQCLEEVVAFLPG